MANYKKTLAFILVIFIMVSLLVGCNRQIIDTTYHFDRAIVSLPNGEVIEGKLTSWRDYDGDQIQVKINDKTYLVHSSNVVLISE